MKIIHPTDESSWIGLPPGIVELISTEILPGLVDEVEDLDPDEDGSVVVLIEDMADFHESSDYQLFYGDFPDGVYWEYVSYFSEFKLFFAQTGVNQMVGVIVPDLPWLDRNVRNRLVAQAAECAA